MLHLEFPYYTFRTPLLPRIPHTEIELREEFSKYCRKKKIAALQEPYKKTTVHKIFAIFFFSTTETTVHYVSKKAQITATREESQWIVGQSPLSSLTIPGCC